MTIFTVVSTCKTCGDVEPPLNTLTLMVSVADPARSFVAFNCPVCHVAIKKAAPPVLVEKLRQARVMPIPFDLDPRDDIARIAEMEGSR